MKTKAESPLTAGEWESLLCQAPDDIRRLIYRLAVHFDVVKLTPAGCPLCQKREDA